MIFSQTQFDLFSRWRNVQFGVIKTSCRKCMKSFAKLFLCFHFIFRFALTRRVLFVTNYFSFRVSKFKLVIEIPVGES